MGRDVLFISIFAVKFLIHLIFYSEYIFLDMFAHRKKETEQRWLFSSSFDSSVWYFTEQKVKQNNVRSSITSYTLS